jgi:hypothetical protein
MIIDTSAEPEPKPRRMQPFRRSGPIIRFTPDQSRRQNDLLRQAWQILRSKDAVIAFLNTRHDGLGGEPLALALASDDGLRSAEGLLKDMRENPAG